MRKLFSFFIAFTSYLLSYPQYELPAFGKPILSELQMKECPFEKGASSMKILDFQETEITAHYEYLKIETNRRVRIKIFNADGFSAANVTIPYIKINRTSKINDISAYIYNLDSAGNINVQKIEKKQIFKEKSEEGINKVAFTFPNVKAGSVIEYRFTHSERNVMHLEPWLFQAAMPTALSICKFIYPKEMKFDFRLITNDSVINDYYTNTEKITRNFILKNIHGFRPEAMMSSVKDNLQRVEFALMPRLGFFDFNNDESRWSFYDRLLLREYNSISKITSLIPGTEQILDSARFFSTKPEKVNFIFQSVKKNLTWDNSQSFYADNLQEVWKTKSANSAEINLTILNLLRRSGIQCYPVLVSTRENGRTDPDFISLGQFNGVDVLILDSANYYMLDGTQRYTSFKTTPYNILNRAALLMDTYEHKWINIVDDRPLMKTTIAVNAKVNSDAQLIGEANISFFDHSKASTLEDENQKKTDEQQEQEDKEFIQKEFEALIIDSLMQENEENELMPLVKKFNFTYKLSSTGNYFILDPFFLSSFRKNPFSDSTRHTDIDMGSNQSYTMYLHLKISDEYIVEELPKNILVRSIDSSMLFKREIFREGNTIVFRNSFDIQRPIYSKEEYIGIKEYFKRIYEVINDRIVLKKKN